MATAICRRESWAAVCYGGSDQSAAAARAGWTYRVTTVYPESEEPIECCQGAGSWRFS